MSTRPIIAIPMGDPAGIGPEIVVKALANHNIYAIARPIVCGDVGVLKRAAEVCKVQVEIVALNDISQASYTKDRIEVLEPYSLDIDDFSWGIERAAYGQAAYDYIKQAAELGLKGHVDAMATSTINKVSLKLAGIPFIGHTEILGSLCDTEDPLTLFETRGLRVFFLTRHLALKDAIPRITEDKVHEYLVRGDKVLAQLGLKDRHIAVAALNPHAGENGLFGNEENEYLVPAIARAQADGVAVSGPIAADSVFHLALEGHYDAVLSLYHDQGHIATKTLDFYRTISITAGLPFLRTSVDHGTAFDIAGTGKASEISMAEAIKLAARYGIAYRDARSPTQRF